MGSPAQISHNSAVHLCGYTLRTLGPGTAVLLGASNGAVCPANPSEQYWAPTQVAFGNQVVAVIPPQRATTSPQTGHSNLRRRQY